MGDLGSIPRMGRSPGAGHGDREYRRTLPASFGTEHHCSALRIPGDTWEDFGFVSLGGSTLSADVAQFWWTMRTVEVEGALKNFQ